MKYIFLDIDGVLNYQLFWKEKRQHIRIKEELEGAPEGSWDICCEKIKLLNSLIKDTGAEVVISSSWRSSYTVEELQELFDYKGFNGDIIGKTPHLWLQSNIEDYGCSVPRGCEIKAWLDINEGRLQAKTSNVKYVIFDDDSDMLYWQRNNFFWIDPYCGLTPNIIYQAKRFLNS